MYNNTLKICILYNVCIYVLSRKFGNGKVYTWYTAAFYDFFCTGFFLEKFSANVRMIASYEQNTCMNLIKLLRIMV